MIDKEQLQIIAELMEELEKEMDIGPEDLDERLGRKPEVKIEIESKSEDEDMVSMPKEEFGEEHKRLVDVLKSPSHEDDLEEAHEQEEELKEQGPEAELKQRILRLRE